MTTARPDLYCSPSVVGASRRRSAANCAAVEIGGAYASKGAGWEQQVAKLSQRRESAGSLTSRRRQRCMMQPLPALFLCHHVNTVSIIAVMTSLNCGVDVLCFRAVEPDSS